MTTIASTAPFLPRDKKLLQKQLVDWNLTEDLAIRDEADGHISVYAKGGATSWPYEWTPEGDDTFDEFEISEFLYQVAQPGQSIRTQDSRGTQGVYISAHVAASETA